MQFGSALSRHPVITVAVGEVVGELLDQVGEEPDLIVLFLTSPLIGAVEDIVSTVRSVLRPKCLIGASGSAIMAGGVGVEDEPGVALWGARFGAEVQPVRLAARNSPEGWLFEGLPEGRHGSGESLILLADPFSFPGEEFLEHMRTARPGLRITGGFASAGRNPGGNRLVLDGEIAARGAVGVVIPGTAHTVVSQGCRPVGRPFIVTRADRNVIYELGGRPAFERLEEMIQGLTPQERSLASVGLHCGVVVDEHKAEFERGDFLVRGVMGANREAGAVVVGDEVPVGATVQFQVRDPASAGEALSDMLKDVRAEGALVFTCNGRGTFMFGSPHHDAEIIDDWLLSSGPQRPAVAGLFCAGELGPVGSRNALHGFAASLALFGSGATIGRTGA